MERKGIGGAPMAVSVTLPAAVGIGAAVPVLVLAGPCVVPPEVLDMLPFDEVLDLV